jgi:hypothetical protein
MKIIISIILISVFLSCSSYSSINSFYNHHKNDTNVTAIEIPQYMLAILRASSGEMNNFMGNVREIRYIHLNPGSEIERTQISNQINGLVSNRFVDVYRKNEDTKRTLISVRENRDVVKEIIVYKNDEKSNSVFYLKGNFNPEKVREYVKNDEFDKLSSTVLQQYNLSPTTIKN